LRLTPQLSAGRGLSVEPDVLQVPDYVDQ
jgi:hypothetical protein